MKKTKKVLSLLLSLSIVLSLATVGNAQSVVVSEDKVLASTIDQYFTEFFSTLDGSYSTFQVADYHLVDEFAAGYNQYLFNLNKEFDLFAKDISYSLHDMKIDIADESANVTLLCDYNLTYMAAGVESAVRNEEYTFGFKKVNDEWLIHKIESTDLLYKSLMERFEKEKIRKSIGATDFFTEELAAMQEYHAFEQKAPDDRYKYQTPTTATKSSYSYYTPDGIEYAQEFAEADESDYIFYDAGADCTNFVSQCVWAAYAGFDKNNISQAITNITNNKCMDTAYPSGWHASVPGGGGYPNWEQVNKFYDYCTDTSKSKGPMATGWGGYSSSSLSPYTPTIGNVLQWSDSSNSYEHSTYVTYNAYNGSTNGVFLCYHTSDNLNRPLTYLINAFSFVRGLSFTNANF